MSGIDTYVLEALYTLRDPSIVQFFIGITELGSTLAIGGVALALGLYLLFREQLSYFAGLCVSVMGTTVTVFILKEFIERARPDTLYQAYLETSFAFPSGHAALSLALYGFIAYLAWKNLSQTRSVVVPLLAALLVGLVGFSRLYLGLHVVSDVLAGYAVGVIFLALGIWISERLKRHPFWS
ncbi:hypothetical protein A3A39_02540 [Candidatus Kaiserbacteria bacterium RIFCSPLOWO2_01_FULL_54_13]|uniref:Phosphatidic acid phosphatase type 2/haloperoxidase domain-containing protein n=1 Tax=Candidatus Kaiserbacteria bacterium RIFCSPLOWO2_01_FULL_54_13 TaxID=1798512 RepID=A0A1F6F3J3_9BACT|nr:MAG: hypothetical protein A3A39_02540 [Candidatus Kaiserbacteria bacterium RIFCSPLOWO2_01_FULL_54_13]